MRTCVLRSCLQHLRRQRLACHGHCACGVWSCLAAEAEQRLSGQAAPTRDELVSEEHPLLTTSAPSDDEWESLSAFDRSEPLYNILEEDLTEIDDALGPMRSPDVVETHVVDGHEVALSLWRVPWSHP